MRTLRASAMAAACGMAAVVSAQGPLAQPGFVAGGPAALGGAAHALYQPTAGGNPAAGQGAFVNAHGEPFVVPTGYGAPCGAGMGGCGPYGGGYGGDCYGGGGCGPYGGGGCGPFGGGGCHSGLWGPTEQCGPHYFDVAVEYLHYFRDDPSFTESTVFSTNGFPSDNDVILDPGGTFFSDEANIALRAGNVNSEDGDGYRLTGRLDLGPLSVAEFTYSGVYWESQAVADQGGSTQLFSIYSLYGTATNGNFNGNGAYDDATFTGPEFEETANANRHLLDYESQLHTAEASYRRYWVGANPRVSGTLLIGFRYTNLEEMLAFRSYNAMSIPSNLDKSADFSVEADNDLLGLQVGGDGWVTLLQGLRVGAEAKAGIYNNDYIVRQRVSASDGDPLSSATLLEGDQAAFLCEAKIMAVADLTPCLSLKAGYEVLFMSELALMRDSLAYAAPYGAVNNIDAFFPGAIPGSASPVATADNDGDVLFHGFSIGAEYVW